MKILANVAVPLYFPQPVLAAVALLPIVAIETVLLRRETRVSWQNVAIANVFSTSVGIPLAMICVLVLRVAFQVVLDKDHSQLSDVVLILAAITIPCFALSVFLEGRYLRTRVSAMTGKSFWFAITKAHVFSYLALTMLYCLWISAGISQ